MAEEEFEKSLEEMRKEFYDQMNECLQKILSKIQPLLDDLKHREKIRMKYGYCPF